MVDNHDFDDFDKILNSIDSIGDTSTEAVDVDELLAQLKVEFPPDFDSTAANKMVNSELQQEEAQSGSDGDAPSGKGSSGKSSKKKRSKEKEKKQKLSRGHRVVNVVLLVIAVLLVAGIAAVLLVQTNSDPYDGKIIANVRVAGVDVGGMTKEEAISAVSEAVGTSYTSNNMTVVIGREELILAASQTQPSLNVSDAVDAAYAYGRTGTTTERQAEYQAAQESPVDISLGSALTLDSDYIRSTVSSFLESISGEYVPSSYTLEGERPSLDADSFDESVPCQNLVLTIGQPGSNYYLSGILTAIANAYSERNFRVEVSSECLPEIPAALDIDAIYNELHVDAVEAVEGTDGAEGTDGSCGYTFSLEDARQQLNNASYGDVITIPMEYIIPEKLSSNGTFVASLASCATDISSNENYNANLELFCQTLNGMTLEAGESFSFDEVFSDISEANGYLTAPSHGDQCIDEEVGGGADQIATTLYVAAMKSGMKLVQHHSGDHVCPYTTKGTETTVSGWRDLKFRNSLDCAVMIRAKVTDSQLIIRFLSEEEVDYEVKLETEELTVTEPGSVTVQKSISDGYKGQQVLVEGIAGGQIRLNWITYEKGTDTVISTYSEYIVLPALDKAVVELIG